MSVWRGADDVPHSGILPPYEAGWWPDPASFCRRVSCQVADIISHVKHTTTTTTGSAICWWHCSKRGRPYSSHRLRWTIQATLSRLFLYSSCASVLHSLVKCATVSSLHLTLPSFVCFHFDDISS